MTDGGSRFDAPAADALARAEQRAAELQAELVSRTRELARSEAKYHELFDASPDLYLVVDARGRIAEVNRTLLRATGYRHEELLGRRAPTLLVAEARRRLWSALPSSGGRHTGCTVLTGVQTCALPIFYLVVNAAAVRDRSEERRVGKESRSRWSP